MATFVQYGPVVTVEPPVICSTAELFALVLPANEEKLRNLCHRVFEIPSGSKVKCRPMGGYVFLIFGQIRKVSAKSIKPGVKEKNVIFHVPVIVHYDGKEVPALFDPYIFVDNPNSMAGGREVFGYAKSYGQVEMSGPLRLPSDMLLCVFGGNDDQELWDFGKRLVHVQRLGPLPAELVAIGDLITDAILPVHDILHDWAHKGVKQLFLKQFRSIDDFNANPPQCSLQQITLAEYQPTIQTLDLLSYRFRVTIERVGSHPVRKELGLHRTCDVEGGFRLETDFTLGDGKVLWSL